MKNHYGLICLYLIGILLLGSCKKKNGDTPPDPPGPGPAHCYERSYWDTIPIPNQEFRFHDFTEDRDFNIVYAWDTDDNAPTGVSLTKIDTGLNEIWTKYYPGIKRSYSNLIHDNSNNYYLVSRHGSFSSSSNGEYLQNVYWQAGSHSDTCAVYYYLGSDTHNIRKDESVTLINKISSSGDLLWTTEVQKNAVWSENNAVVSDNGEVFIATYTRPGLNYFMVFRDGIFQDTMRLADSIDFHLYKISPSGDQIWARSVKIPTLFLDEWYEPWYNLNIGVSISNDLIYVTAFTGVFIFNMEGDLLNQDMISETECRHFFARSTSFTDGEMPVICRYSDFGKEGQNIYYAAKYSTGGSLQWLEEVNCKSNYYFSSLLDGGLLLKSESSIRKYDPSGYLLWVKDFYPNYLRRIKPNCNSGFILMMTQNEYPDQIVVIRSDENGEY